MSDDPVATEIDTLDGSLAFQEYFVRLRCAPVATAIRFEGAGTAEPAPGVVEALECAEAILIAPSNPFLSVDPILAVPAIRAALERARAPVVAVSSLVSGGAVKGPTAKLTRELGLEVSAEAVAAHYGDVIDAMLIDERDPPGGPTVRHARADTLMHTLDDPIRVAKAALALARSATA